MPKSKMKQKDKEITKKTFSKRFIDLWNDSHLNRDEIAKELDVSSSSIRNWAIGERLPDADALARISKFFNVSADYLIGLTDIKSTDPEIKAIAEYIGLSEYSVKVLHFLHTAKYDPESDNPTEEPMNRATLDFIEEALGSIINNDNEYHEYEQIKIENNEAAPISNVLVWMWEYIHATKISYETVGDECDMRNNVRYEGTASNSVPNFMILQAMNLKNIIDWLNLKADLYRVREWSEYAEHKREEN